MKKHFLLVSLLMMAAVVSAAVVEPEQALQVANAFVPSHVKMKQNAQGPAAVRTGEIVYTHYMPKSGKAAFYVVSMNDAFVIVSADDVAHPILGYSFMTSWPKDITLLPAPVKGYFEELAVQIESASDLTADNETVEEWHHPQRAYEKASAADLPSSVEPLLSTQWDQGQYYNTFCPSDEQSPFDGRVPTGCLATAMAQLIKYWQYPANGRGQHRYTGRYGVMSVDYDHTTYDYTLMPDQLTASSSEEEINSVAGLIRDCGVAVNMDYQTNSSGASSPDIRAALVSQYRYSPSMFFAERALYESEEWKNLLQQEISEGRPVIYGGNGDSGHSFICDGYKSDDYFHFNFGWSGNWDGWYLLSAVNVGERNYNSNQHIIAGIQPDNSSEYLYSCVGMMVQEITSYQVDNTIVFANTLYQNSGRTSKDIGRNNTIVTFVSSDPAQQLVMECITFEGQSVSVYDGVPQDNALPESLVRTYAEGADNTDQPVVSTQGALTVYIQHKYNQSKGFCFRISPEAEAQCRMVSNVISTVNESTVQLTWQENGNATQWDVEYGLKGFEPGQGILLQVTEPQVTLEDLTAFKEYDVYIKPSCENLWRKISVTPSAKLWEDIVVTEPEGYEEDEAGNAYISSAEGLVWLAKNTYEKNYFRGRKVFLTEDINLGKYNWTGISGFYGTFDGQGHTIDSLYSIGGFKNPAFVGTLMNGSLKNINLTNVSVDGCAALVCYGYGRDTIMNCFVSGVVRGGNRLDVGAILGDARGGEYVYILNCVAHCDVSGGRYTGGIAGCGNSGNGNGRHLIIKNCYSTGNIEGSMIVKYAEYATVENCYGDSKTQSNGTIIGGGKGNKISDNTTFIETDNGYELKQPVFFDIDSLYRTDLKEALNAGVRKMNLQGLRVWEDDVKGINNGMPVLGEEYTITCPNIRNLTANCFIGEDKRCGLELSWSEIGDANQWMIEMIREKPNDTIRMITRNNPDSIYGLEEGISYSVRVFPYCGDHNRGGWSDALIVVFDRPYWKNMVTAQPDGFEMDGEGNAIISTTEGLVWFANMVTGYKQTANSFEDKTVSLTKDVDIDMYKWTPINGFLGTFDGGEHIISGLYVNETTNNVGMFGSVNGGTYKNIILKNAYVHGAEQVGILVGIANKDTYFINCHIEGEVSGATFVGGLAGRLWNSYLVSGCSTTGKASAQHDYVGGLVGEIGGSVGVEYTHVLNCYSRSTIKSGRYGEGGLIGIGEYKLENSYATGDVTKGFMFNGGIVGSISNGKSFMRNCYGGGHVQQTILATSNDQYLGYRFGAIAGTSAKSPLIANCYGLEDPELPIMVGISDDGTEPVMSENSLFAVEEDQIQLLDSVMVGDKRYGDLLSALNAWVEANNSDGLYRRWAPDTDNINNGYPVFAPLQENVETALEAPAPINVRVTKMLYNGQIFILRDGKTYTITGARVK